ncbi:hypothetical protein FOZ63_021379 [Perkinsus olseni]|uniref:Integrase catalytic domain-containing protein n=1 Tax=Perkinsus olseni TaxID=32597 RepID=A0A7J6Q532_PEROL|nr:hypothetical protein FOZ63_021379 [Perkinsus olseni]
MAIKRPAEQPNSPNNPKHPKLKAIDDPTTTLPTTTCPTLDSSLLEILQSGATVSKPDRRQLLEQVHHDYGHEGITTVNKRINAFNISWPELHSELEDLTKHCQTCQATTNYPLDRALKSPPSTIPQGLINSDAWSIIYMDVIGPHTFDNTQHYAITIMDSYSSSVIIYPTTSTPTTQDAIDALSTIQRYYHRHPAGLQVLTDRGSIFTSRSFNDHLQAIQAEHLLSPVDSGESNGRLERLHREVAHKLRVFLYPYNDRANNINTNNTANWSTLCDRISFAVNTSPTADPNTSTNATTVHCPHNLIFHYSPYGDTLQHDIIDNKHQKVLQRRRAKAHLHQKYRDDELEIDDLVWLNQQAKKSDASIPKLAPRYIGPFHIKTINGNRITLTGYDGTEEEVSSRDIKLCFEPDIDSD